MPIDIQTVPLSVPPELNIIFGQSHFIKTVEDLYEVLITSVPNIGFGLAFAEASGPCLLRSDGTDESLRKIAEDNLLAVGAGHTFLIVLRDAFPINVLSRVRDCPEVVSVYCATANPVEVIIAETKQGRGVLGVVDGASPQGLESQEDRDHRHAFLRMIGYKR